MNIETMVAAQSLISYLNPPERRYFEVNAILLGYYEDEKYLFGFFDAGGANKLPYKVTISVQTNEITFEVPSFTNFGYYSKFSTSYQNMEFDEERKILTIRGEKAKSGKPYKMRLGFDIGSYAEDNFE